MKGKKLLSMLTCMTLAVSLLSGCGGNAANTTSSTKSTGSNTASYAKSGSTASADDLTAEEKEAVEAGIINLDGTLPIVKDPKAFEEKYGKISMLLVNSADRVVAPGELAMVKKWAEDTGVEFDWQPIPGEGAQEKINLMLASGDDLPDIFWNFGGG